MAKEAQLFLPVPGRLTEAMAYRVHAAGRSVFLRADGRVQEAYHQNTLILTRSGAGRIEVGARFFLAEEGSVTWLDTSRPYAHSAAGNAAWEYGWIGLSGHGLDRVFVDLGFGEEPVAPASAGFVRAFEQVLAAMAQPDPLAEARVNAGVAGMLLDLAIVRSGHLHRQGEDRLAALMREMRRMPQEAWPIARMADRAGLSQAQLFRRFRAASGRTPMQWLREERIERARHLLRATAGKSASIARDCGYADPFHFSRDFKRLTGLSPRQWRLAGGPGA